MRADIVRKYASGNAPYLGVPVFDMAIGRTVTAVFRREHLQVATEAAIQYHAKIEYDCVFHTLNFNSVKECSYKLRDLKNHPDSNIKPWEIQAANAAWASGRRKSAVTRALPMEQRKAAKLELEVGKLTRKLDKVYAHRPVHPLISVTERWHAGESYRQAELNWRAEKPMRRALGRLVRRERKTWAAFYADVAAIIGHEVSDGYRHDKVCARRHGPDRAVYLKYLWQYIGMASKPYDRGREWNPFKLEYGEPNSFVRHREAQREYLVHMQERRNLETQIGALRAEIAELKGEVQP